MSRKTSDADDTEKPAERRFGCLFYATGFLFALGVGLTVWFRLWHASANKELRAEMDKIRARGEPLWFSDLAPPMVDPELDATPLLLSALSKFKKPSPAFYALVSPEPPAPRTRPGRYDMFESVLADNRPALELLGRAVRRPYFRLPIDYRTRQPFTILLQPIQDAREIASLLAADVLQSIGSGDNDRAVAAVLDGLGLAELLRDEPFLITQLVRVAIAGQAIKSLETVVSQVELTPDQFAALDNQLVLMERRFQLAPYVRSERAMLLTGMDSLGENPEQVDAMIGSGKPVARILSSAGLGPLRMRDEAFMLRLMSGFAEAVDMPGPEGKAALKRLEAELQPSFQHIFSRLLAPTVLPAREAALNHRQRLMNARLGIRVRRFYENHGKFPESLDVVTDESVPSIPPDLFARRPLVYRVLSDGFVIYPVGDNGIDDGGGEQPDLQEHATRFEVHLPAAQD
jgi:hypothetical protein